MPFDASQNPRQIAADVLRNTDKRQGRYKLHKNGAFCALGVLYSEICGAEITSNSDHSDDCKFLQRQMNLPVDQIFEMNDGGATFSEIANWLESLPE